MNTLIKGKAFFADNKIHVALSDGTDLSFPIAGNWRLDRILTKIFLSRAYCVVTMANM